MKKEDIVSLVVYLLMIAVAILVGLLVISHLFDDFGIPSGGGRIGFAILFVIISLLVNAPLLELGHVIGAKMGNYKVTSFNFLGLCFYKKEGKLKFKFSNFDGLTGETKIAPNKDQTKPSSPRAFAIMPLIVYAIEIAAFLVVFSMLYGLAKSSSSGGTNFIGLLEVLLIMMVTIGGMLHLYNIFPAHLDSTTDGYRLIIFSKKENLEAYNELMRIENSYMEGKEVTEFKVFDNITDFTSQVNLYSVYDKLNNKKYDEAEEILDKIIANKDKIHAETYDNALAQKLYLMLMNKPFEVAREYYEKNVTSNDRRIIANDLSMESIRTYLLISSMLDISEQEARYAISRKPRAIKRTLPGRVKIENELYESALNKVNEIRPEWRIKEKEIK